MKKILLAAAALGFMFAAAPQASALTVDGLLGSADLGNSGDQLEFDTLCAIAGISDCTGLTKVDSQGGASWDIASLAWVIDVTPNMPGFFMLKFGTGNTGFDSHYFFENLGELSKLVFQNGQVNGLAGFCGDSICDIDKLSHFVYSGDVDIDPDPIPLPGGIVLLLSGLVGLGGLARMRKSASKTA